MEANGIVKFITDTGATVSHDPYIGGLMLNLVNEFCEKSSYIGFLFKSCCNNYMIKNVEDS